MKSHHALLFKMLTLGTTVLAQMVPATLHAQSQQRLSVTAAPTILPFSTLSGATLPAALVTGGMDVVARKHWSAGLTARAIVPLMGTSVAADCIPDVPCPTFQSPDALYTATADLSVITLRGKLRTSLGAGFISAQNLSDNTPTNSPTVELGVEYAFVTSHRISPIVSVHVQRLTRDVGGLTALVLPGFGIRF